MKKSFKKMCSILLSILIISISMFGTIGVQAEDFDFDLGEIEDYEVVFVNSSGETINSDDEYGEIIFNGERVNGASASVDLKYGDGTNAYEFLGWYDGDELISKDLPFSHTYGDYKDFYAKVLTHNVLKEGASFESIYSSDSVKVAVNNTDAYYYKDGNNFFLVKTGEAPSGNLWGGYSNFAYPMYEKIGEEYKAIENPAKGAYCGDDYFTIKSLVGEYEHTYYTDYDNDTTAKATITVKPHTGNTMIGINAYWRHCIKELSGLEKNTDYVLSVWVYTQNDTSCLSWAAVANNYEGLRTGSSKPHLDSCELLGVTGFTANYGEWTQLKIPFNSGENTVAYFDIGHNKGKFTGGNEGMNFIDDLTVCKADAVGYTGTKQLAENGDIIVKGTPVSNDFNVALDYTGSAIEFNANCKGDVKIQYSAVLLNGFTLRFKVIVDGIEKEDATIKERFYGELLLAENLPEGEHTFKLVRATEAVFGSVFITDINIDGEYLEPPTKPKYNIDFYGDSLTAGYGTTYFKDDSDWAYYEDGSKAYAYLSSQVVDANPRIFAYSGIGVAVGSNGDGSGETIVDRYATLPKNTNADVVVIYLGTNDKGKYSKLGLTIDEVVAEFNSFIKTVRNDYANSKIVMLHYATTENIILPAVELAKEDGVTNIYTLEVPCGASGAASHPNIAEQAETAEVVTEFLSNLLSEDNWFNPEFIGNSIRSTGNQGLRFKFKFDADIIENGYDGYTVKEMGALAIRTDYLGGKELVKDGSYIYNKVSKNAVTGVFYSKEKNINMLDENGIGSALLYNIGYNKTTKTSNYTVYGKNFSVRPYVVLENGDGETVLYGEIKSVSVFNVMKAIQDKYLLEQPEENTQLFNDYNSVMAFFNIDKVDINQNTIAMAYDKWKEN